MQRLAFNEGTLIFDSNINVIIYQIPKDRTQVFSVIELEELKQDREYGFPVRDITLGDNAIRIEYEVEEGYEPLTAIRRKDLSLKTKLNIALSLVVLSQNLFNDGSIVTVLDNVNVYFNDEGEVKLLYRGISQLLPATGYQKELILESTKKLIFFMFTTVKWREISFHGNDSVIRHAPDNTTRKLLHELNQVSSFIELKGFVESKIKEREQLEAKDAEEVLSAKGGLLLKLVSLQKTVTRVRKLKVQEKKKKPPAPGLKKERKPLKISRMALKAIVGGGVILLCLFIGGYIYVNSPAKAKGKTESSQVDPYVLKALQYASIQNYDDAVKEFEKGDYKHLEANDKKALLFSYLMTGEIQRALSIQPDFVKEAFNFAKQQGNKELMKKIKEVEKQLVDQTVQNSDEKKAKMDALQKEIDEIQYNLK